MLDIVFVADLRKNLMVLSVLNSPHIEITVYYKRKTFFLKNVMVKNEGTCTCKYMCMNCITRYTHVIHAVQHKLYPY